MMSNLRNLAIALWLAIWLIPATMVSPSWGDENQTKIDLQAALLNFLDMSADQQGRFRVIDRVSGKVLHTYAGAMHPKIVPFGEDRVLCIEMFDTTGQSHAADFVMRQTPVGWMVVDVLFDQRPLLKKALAGAQ